MRCGDVVGDRGMQGEGNMRGGHGVEREGEVR